MTKFFQQKINQYHTIQITMNKSYYDTLYKYAYCLNLKFDDFIILNNLRAIGSTVQAIEYLKDIKYDVNFEKISNWINQIKDKTNYLREEYNKACNEIQDLNIEIVELKESVDYLEHKLSDPQGSYF